LVYTFLLMKISYRTHPILEMLESGTLEKLHTTPEDSKVLQESFTLIEGKPVSRNKMLQLAWKNSSKLLNQQDIKIITDPFYDAFGKAKEKLSTSELMEEMLSGTSIGTIIYRDNVICYLIEDAEIEGKKIHAGTFYFFIVAERGKLVPMFAVTISPNQKFEPIFLSSALVKAERDVDEYLNGLFYDTILLLNFIKYAEVETKYLPAGQKVKGVNCKYINETRSNVKILDSTWFTELVKSDAFKVRGHFRLQPKKRNGEWTKELIWIKDFEKGSYIRRAGKTIN
jgi:hypothetical protein